MTVPRLSVIIPTFNRPHELSLCLQALAQQSAPHDAFEVIVVDDGSTVDLEPARSAAAANVSWARCGHLGIAAARNAGIECAQAPLVLLYDDDLRPAPHLVDYCLDFHRRHPAEPDAALLYFNADETIGDAPVLRWGFSRMYPFPAAGVWNWPCFWGGTVTCKKSLFRHGGFNPSYLSVEDGEFAVRVSQTSGLRVHFEGLLTGAMTRRPTFAQIFRRQYLMGYFACRLERDYPAAVRFASPPYDRPEDYIFEDRGRLRALLASAQGLESLPGAGGARFELLSAIWTRAEVHARATGWIHSRQGRPPNHEEAA